MRLKFTANNHPSNKKKNWFIMPGLVNRWYGQGLPSHFNCLHSECDKPFYFWSRGNYLLYNATNIEEIQQKQKKTPNNLISSQANNNFLTREEICFPPSCLFCQQEEITPMMESSAINMTMHLFVNSSFLVCLFVNLVLHKNGGYWHHKHYWCHFCTLHCFVLNQNCNTVFIQPTAFCFILKVGVYR